MKTINKICLVSVVILLTVLLVLVGVNIWGSSATIMEKSILSCAGGLVYVVFLGVITSY